VTLPKTLFAACASAFVATTVSAQSKVSVEIGGLEFEGLVVEELALDWAPDGTAEGALGLKAARIRGFSATGPLSAFSFDCLALRISGDELRCESGRLSGSFGSLGVQDTRFKAKKLADGSLKLGFESFAIAGGRGRLDLDIEGSRWRMESDLAGLELEKLASVAKPWVALPEGFAVAGSADGRFRATGNGDAVATASAEVALEELNFSDAAGTLAGEKLAGTIRIDATVDETSRLPAHGRITLVAGQAYSDPVFLDFAAHRAELDFAGTLDMEATRFEADAFSLDHAGVTKAGGKAIVDLAGDILLPAAQIRIESLDLAGALPAYVQPFLIDSAFKDIVGSGTIRGDVAIDRGLPTRAEFDLESVTIDSPTAAVSLEGLRGRLNWFDDASRSALAGTIDDDRFLSRLAWDAARLWGLELGRIELPFATTGRHFRLLEPVKLPVFDGGLAIETLRVRHAGTEEMYVRFDAAIEPISVSLLSRAFGWPEFQGKLAGSIPGLQLRQGVVTLDGNLEASVFDGRVVVKDLSLSEPLGKFPRMHAGIDLEDLDLALVTQTFEFGMITGRLSGRIAGLETFGWMPEAFDAFLYTPPDDRSKHRISQRAVTNLSSIGGGSGGGVAAALQGGFLKFFDDFRYDRLGLSCRLANDVCVMGGVLPAPGGYYIVKGSGLPRIDVIGSQTRVAWTTLVRQLGSIMESEIVVE
jgi:hypothetical protein